MRMRRKREEYEPFAHLSRRLELLTCASPQIREGFIVDEDEEEEADGLEERERRKKKKRPRVEELLDEEDLDLIGENNPEWERKSQPQVTFACPRPRLAFVNLHSAIDEIQASEAGAPR